MDYYAIGQRIRRIRKANGLSQDNLAEMVNISTAHMSHIETGNTKMSLKVFVNLAAALGVRTDELLYDSSPAVRSACIDSVIHILDECTAQQLNIMEDILRATKAALDKNLKS